MTSTTTVAFQVHAIDPDPLDTLRANGTDASGNLLEHVVATGGEPLRCCLRYADDGEALILFGFEPALPASPYREVGAVFTHAQRCAGPADGDGYPATWRDRAQVLRAYDSRGWIHDSSTVHEGGDPERVIAEQFAHREVVLIHSRNIAYGCYMFAVTRPAG
jgi:Protein of unknown function (DUF1203)